MSKLDKDIEEEEARLHAEHISEDKEKPHFIGKPTVAVLQQTFFSLLNTKEAFRDDKWLTQWNKMKKDILSLKDGNLVYSSFRSKYGSLGRIPA